MQKEVQEKAKELVQKFRAAMPLLTNKKFYNDMHTKVSKQCALICLSENISLIDKLIETDLNNDFDLLDKRGELFDIRTAIEQTI